MATWRDKAAPIIARVIKEKGTDDLPKLRAALREAYPFGERAYHPYKIWRDEIKRQLGEPAPTMSVASALQMERDIWSGNTLAINEQDCARLSKLGTELQKSIILLNAEDVMIREADARFLRRLHKAAVAEDESPKVAQ
jgi:hypothetical protein